VTIEEARLNIGKTVTCSCSSCVPPRTGVIAFTSEKFVFVEVPDLPAEHIAIPETLILAEPGQAVTR